jgi:hypothetical protein
MKKILLALMLYSTIALGNDEYQENYYRKIAIHFDQHHHEYLIIQTNDHVVVYSMQPIVLHNQSKETVILSAEDYKHLVHEFF